MGKDTLGVIITLFVLSRNNEKRELKITDPLNLRVFLGFSLTSKYRDVQVVNIKWYYTSSSIPEFTFSLLLTVPNIEQMLHSH